MIKLADVKDAVLAANCLKNVFFLKKKREHFIAEYINSDFQAAGNILELKKNS